MAEAAARIRGAREGASRRGDRVRVLYWDRDGYVLVTKRLEKNCVAPGARARRDWLAKELGPLTVPLPLPAEVADAVELTNLSRSRV